MLGSAGGSCEGSTSDSSSPAAAGQDRAPGTDDKTGDKRTHETPCISGLLFINSHTGIESKPADAAGLLHLSAFLPPPSNFLFLSL